jgi:sterol desaturase/sphingolipid hydroxylase (fatty acid hydroxylase superfamily)
MHEAILANEPWIRLGCAAGLLLVMVLWERLAPRRAAAEGRLRHGARNLAVAALDVLVVRLLVPLVPAGLAIVAAERGWGLFHLLSWPGWLEIGLSVVAFDFAIYLQHVTFHAVPALWRLHMVHHADLDFDATTGVRFHPLEILLSLGIKLGLVLVLGPPAVAVVLFEVLLNATSLFNHGNVRLPVAFDRWLRWIVVTPDMHRVHHSIARRETNSNFGFNLPWWDRLLGTYRDQPAAGHETMTIGIEPFRRRDQVLFTKLLTMPFARQRGGYPIDGGEEPGP